MFYNYGLCPDPCLPLEQKYICYRFSPRISVVIDGHLEYKNYL